MIDKIFDRSVIWTDISQPDRTLVCDKVALLGVRQTDGPAKDPLVFLISSSSAWATGKLARIGFISLSYAVAHLQIRDLIQVQ